MKRYSIAELEGLLSGTTPGGWSEEKIGAIFRSSSVSGECGRRVLMAEVKDDDGRSRYSDCHRKNAVLMVQARNLAMELLEMKQRVAWMESTNNFDATRLRRLATICGVSLGDESDEFVLNCAGTILGSIYRVVEGMMKGAPYRDTFDVDHPGESGAGIAHFTDVVRIEVESGDPGGGPNEFMEHMLDALKEWYDGARVSVRDGSGGEPCPACQCRSTVKTGGHNGVQGDGQETGVATLQCNQCQNEWTD